MKKNKTMVLFMVGLFVVLAIGTTVTIQANANSQVTANQASMDNCPPDQCPPDQPCDPMENCDSATMQDCGSSCGSQGGC